mgnify:CR=1 FL=1
MSKAEIIEFIEEIDEQIEKNHKVIAAHGGNAAMILHPTTRLLMSIREMWVDMLLYDYGVFHD